MIFISLFRHFSPKPVSQIGIFIVTRKLVVEEFLRIEALVQRQSHKTSTGIFGLSFTFLKSKSHWMSNIIYSTLYTISIHVFSFILCRAECFDSLHIYEDDISPTNGKAGRVTYRYFTCRFTNCGPNVCCCRFNEV